MRWGDGDWFVMYVLNKYSMLIILCKLVVYVN